MPPPDRCGTMSSSAWRWTAAIRAVSYTHLPHKRYRKYLRFFAGLILVLLVASPLLQAGGLEQRMLEVLDSLTSTTPSGEMEEIWEQAEAARSEGLSQEYQAVLQAQVETAAAAYGYQVASCSAEIVLEEGAADFGEIRRLSAVLTRGQGASSGQEEEIWVEPVQIGEAEASPAEEEDLSALATELAGSLGIREEQISLTVSG